jgi:hypothetical protein
VQPVFHSLVVFRLYSLAFLPRLPISARLARQGWSSLFIISFDPFEEVFISSSIKVARYSSFQYRLFARLIDFISGFILIKYRFSLLPPALYLNRAPHGFRMVTTLAPTFLTWPKVKFLKSELRVKFFFSYFAIPALIAYFCHLFLLCVTISLCIPIHNIRVLWADTWVGSLSSACMLAARYLSYSCTCVSCPSSYSSLLSVAVFADVDQVFSSLKSYFS